MVGNITSGQSFGRLGWYLAEKDPDRVAWTAARNTSEREPARIAKEMQDMAACSSRVEKPVYHVSISLDPGDDLSDEQLKGVADQTLRDLGLEEHQAAFVAHDDTDHPHVHLMVNRVHPGTEKAWEAWKDRNRLKLSLERQERELGVRLTGSNVEHGDRDRQPSRSIGEIKEAERRGEKSFPDQVREKALSDFKEANGWGDLERRLDEHGLQLVGGRKRGGVVTDGERHTKLSKVSRSISRTKLDERFGQTYTDHKQRRNHMAEGTQTKQQRPKEVEEFSSSFRGKLEAARKDVESASSREELREGLKRNGLDIEMSESGRSAEIVNQEDPTERISVRDLNSAYQKDGRLAPERDTPARSGPDASDVAGQSLKGKGLGGDGKTTNTSRGGGTRFAGEMAREVIEPMEEESDAMKKAARFAAALGRMADRVRRRRQRRSERSSSAEIGGGELTQEAGAEATRVDRAEEAISKHQDRCDLENDHRELSQEVEGAESELESIEQDEAELERARRDIDEAVNTAYATPDEAQKQIREAAEKQGVEQTAEDLRERPEQFGAMDTTKGARDAAERAADRLKNAAEKIRMTPTPEQQQELRVRIQESRDELAEIEDQIGAAGSGESRKEVGQRVAQLDQKEVEELEGRIGSEEMRSVEHAVQVYREERTRQDIQEHQEVKQMEKDRRTAMKTVTEGEKRLSEDDRVQEKLERADREFTDNLKEAYEDPDRAREKFNRMAEEESATGASRQMRRSPEDFGKLRETKQKSGVLSTKMTDEPAREAASVAANRGKTVKQLRDRAMSAGVRTELKEGLREAREKGRRLTKALEKDTSTRSLKQQIGQRMKKMSKQSRKSFVKSLGEKGKAVAKAGMAAVGAGAINATMDKEHGRSL